jgi:hypothetical protein
MDGLHEGLCSKVEVLPLCAGLVNLAYSDYGASRAISQAARGDFNREAMGGSDL